MHVVCNSHIYGQMNPALTSYFYQAALIMLDTVTID